MQASVLAPVSRAARFTEWDLSPGADPGAVRRAIAALAVDADTLVGIGAPLAAYLGVSRDELRGFPAMTGRGVTAPSSQHALLIRAAATDPGAALHAARRAAGPLTGLFRCADATDAAMYDSGRDLTGYVDGTENPTGSAAEAAALASDGSISHCRSRAAAISISALSALISVSKARKADAACRARGSRRSTSATCVLSSCNSARRARSRRRAASTASRPGYPGARTASRTSRNDTLAITRDAICSTHPYG